MKETPANGRACNALSSRTNPLATARRRLRATWALGSLAVLGCGFWAFQPLAVVEAKTPELPEFDEIAALPTEEEDPFLLEAFDVELWKAPKEEPSASQTAATKPTRVPPLRLQLVAISHSADGPVAALYDPNEDRLRYYEAGDEVAGLTVSAIHANSVELSHGTTTRSLILKKEREQ